ncbi:MAG: hypothetical protein ABI528_08145 [bacterium]
MKLFNKLLLSVLLFAIVGGCNQKISQGLQRKKFEFLYKMSNYSSLFREYAGSIIYPHDIDFYENRMKKVAGDVSEMKSIEEWPVSGSLKEEFLAAVQSNSVSIGKLRLKDLPDSLDIRKEYEVMLINGQVDKFIKSLDDEISVVGKE